MPSRYFLLVSLLACTSDPEVATSSESTTPAVETLDTGPTTDDATVRVGTFNINWLWSHYEGEYEPRNEVDYAMIAQLIVEMDLDVLALQEVEGEGALELLGLPERFEWVVGRSGWSQNLAVVVQSDRVALGASQEPILPSSEWPSKDPLLVEITPSNGAPSFTVVNVHFHPFTNAEDSAYRSQQASELHDYLAGLPFDQNLVVLGDFNDTFEGLHADYPSLEVFEDDANYTFASRDTDEFTQIPYRSKIDHIVLSEGLFTHYHGDCEVVLHDQVSPYSDYEGGYGDRQNISSHRPMIVELGGAR